MSGCFLLHLNVPQWPLIWLFPGSKSLPWLSQMWSLPLPPSPIPTVQAGLDRGGGMRTVSQWKELIWSLPVNQKCAFLPLLSLVSKGPVSPPLLSQVPLTTMLTTLMCAGGRGENLQGSSWGQGVRSCRSLLLLWGFFVSLWGWGWNPGPHAF